MSPILFNTTTSSLDVSINNGPQFQISGAGGPSYMPQSPMGGGPGWSPAFPAPNVLAPGQNLATIFPPGAMPQNLAIFLPNSVSWQSLQLYLLSNGSTLGWLALNNGTYVAGALP